MGFDREQLNETFWLGIGVPGSCVVGDDSPYNPGPEWRKKWSTFDQKQSNELLDKAGLDKKDGEGYRLRTDGKGRLRIEVTTVAGSFMPYTQMMEMIREQWKKIGVQIDITEQERSLWTRRVEANEHQVSVWANDGTDEPYLYPGHWFMSMPNSQCGPAFGRWLQTNGRLGKEPKDPQIKKVYDLFNSAFGKPRPEREKIGQEIWKIVVDEQWIIGVAGLSPAVMGVRLAKNDLGNIPTRQVNGQHVRTEGISHPATFYWKK
jgi:peptide/nickel transport system substrate-binding protein